VSHSAGEWVPPHRLRPVGSERALSALSDLPRLTAPVPRRGADGRVHLFGLPEARNAVCGALAVDRPQEGRELIQDSVVEYSSCLAATPTPLLRWCTARGGPVCQDSGAAHETLHSWAAAPNDVLEDLMVAPRP